MFFDINFRGLVSLKTIIREYSCKILELCIVSLVLRVVLGLVFAMKGG